MTLPFGPISDRTGAQWALLHAGVEFLPVKDRQIIWQRAGGATIELIAKTFEMTELDVERSIGRSSRTLCTWERNANKWATRYVAREPMALAPGASPEREGRHREVAMAET
jgi:hypothetical protein